MKNNIKAIAVICGLALLQSCQKDTTFSITETSVGPLNQSTTVDQLQSVFAQDSIVRDTTMSALASSKKIEVYEKGGKHLLTLTPSSDSIPKIQNVRVMDPRYTAENGIGLSSTFSNIKKKFEIKKVVATLNSIVVFPKGSNLYFTIDKQELPDNLRFSTTIEAVQIPDEAKVKYLMLGWE